MDLAVLEAPAAQVRITGPPPGWVFGRAQPQQTESLRSAPIGAASSRCASLPDPTCHEIAARPVLPIEVVSKRGAVGLKLPASPPELRGWTGFGPELDVLAIFQPILTRDLVG